MTAVAEIHKLDDDFEVQRLARLVVRDDGTVEVVGIASDGAAVARVMLAEALVDPFGQTRTAEHGADFLKTLRWARSSDVLWVTPLAEMAPEAAGDPSVLLPPFEDRSVPPTVPYPAVPASLRSVRVAEVRWPAPQDYRRTEVVARLVSEAGGPVLVEGVLGSVVESRLLESAVARHRLDDLRGQQVAPGMMIVPASFDRPGDAAWRDGLVRARLEASERRDRSAVRRLDAELTTRLPRIWLSRCPFTGQVLRWAVDAYGFDGPYWDPAAPVRPLTDELPATFLGLAGAVPGPTPAGVPPEAVGVARPPVYPELLEQRGVRAVLSATQVGRYRCDVVAYFADPTATAAPAAPAVREWGTRFSRTRGGPAQAWAPAPAADPAIAADLAPWITSGRLAWITPDDLGVELQTGPTGCPWLR